MRIRYINFSQRKVLRCNKDFEYQGVQYKADDVFDWVGMGLKAYHVKRLYLQKLIRHMREDSKTAYPFRAVPAPVEVVEAVENVDGDAVIESDAPDAETETPTTEVDGVEVVEAVAEKPKNFTRKGNKRH